MTTHTRTLPRWQPKGKDVFITWRLHGSLPAHFKVQKLTESAGKHFLKYDLALDAATTGPAWLKEPRVAQSLIAALQRGYKERTFHVHAYAVMLNHVHVLLEPEVPIDHITQIIRGSTARSANSILNRTGTPFWQDESFDHWIRTPQEWDRIRTYIERNPVAAGLVATPEEWPWSSASRPID